MSTQLPDQRAFSPTRASVQTNEAGTTTTEVKIATEADREHLVATIVLAFSRDPVVRWCYPEPSRYLDYWPRFVKAFGGRAFEHGAAHYVDRYGGAALWLPPGVSPDEEELVPLLEHSVPEDVLSDVFAVLEQMGGYHPDEPHWYLPLIGVDPSIQRKGLGSALLRHALTICDEEGKPAYLESSNPLNLPLYERHGFEIIGTIQAGTSPIIWPMLRKPQQKV